MKCDGKKCERGYYRLRVNSVEPSPAPKDVWTLTNSHLLRSSAPPSHPFFKTICPWGAYATQRSNTNSTACAQNNPICSTGATEEWAKKEKTKKKKQDSHQRNTRLASLKFPIHTHTHFPWLFNLVLVGSGSNSGCHITISRYGDGAETENFPSKPQLLLPPQKRHAMGLKFRAAPRPQEEQHEYCTLPPRHGFLDAAALWHGNSCPWLRLSCSYCTDPRRAAASCCASKGFFFFFSKQHRAVLCITTEFFVYCT